MPSRTGGIVLSIDLSIIVWLLADPWDGGGDIIPPFPYATAGRKKRPDGAPRDHMLVCGSS
jgi:hypothetical protein